MVKLLKIKKNNILKIIVALLFLPYYINAQNQSTWKENCIYYTLPYKKSHVKIIGICHSDSLVVVRKTTHRLSSPAYFDFKKMSCEELYVVKNKNYKCLRTISKKRLDYNPTNKTFRLIYDDQLVGELVDSTFHSINGIPYYSNLELKDTIIKQLLLKNCYNRFACWRDSICSNGDFIYLNKKISVNRLTITSFLVLEMGLFEFHQLFYNNCNCYGHGTGLFYRFGQKHKNILIAIPIEYEDYLQCKNTCPKYIIQSPF